MAHVDLVGAVLDGRYKVIEPIAEGAMGVVYRAERVKLGKIVAVKVLHDELPDELASRQRFEIEAMAMAKLEHPHCGAVLDVGTHAGKPFVVMDFVTGEDLKSLIAQGPVPIDRALELVRQVLSGLAHAHELGIIHRDIKPANVLLSQKAGLGDHVTILDFGLARLQSQQTTRLTTGIAVGTPAYMAPEQVRGGEVDPRTDIYASGILLAELVTSHKPFHSVHDDPVEVVRMHLSKPPPRLEALLPGVAFGALEDVVAKALAKAPADRYQTATEFAAALEALAAQRKASSASTSMAATPGAAAAPAVGENASSLSIPLEVAPASSAPASVSGGAPDAEASVAVVSPPIVSPMAPTMPSQSAQPLTASPRPPARRGPDGLPLSRRQLAIGGGAMLVIVIVIAAVAGGGSRDTSEAAHGDAGPGSEIEMQPTDVGDAAHVLTRAEDLIANGEREAAIDLLTKSKAVFPDNARIPYLAGTLYFAKLWWTDGLKCFRDAVRRDPSLRTDPDLIKIVLKGFITTPSYNSELATFLRDDLGAAVRPYLEETAGDHPNSTIRSRASKELTRLR